MLLIHCLGDYELKFNFSQYFELFSRFMIIEIKMMSSYGTNH